MPIGKKTESIYQSKLCESFDFWVQSWLKKVDVSAIATMRLGSSLLLVMALLLYFGMNGIMVIIFDSLGQFGQLMD